MKPRTQLEQMHAFLGGRRDNQRPDYSLALSICHLLSNYTHGKLEYAEMFSIMQDCRRSSDGKFMVEFAVKELEDLMDIAVAMR